MVINWMEQLLFSAVNRSVFVCMFSLSFVEGTQRYLMTNEKQQTNVKLKELWNEWRGINIEEHWKKNEEDGKWKIPLLYDSRLDIVGIGVACVYTYSLYCNGTTLFLFSPHPSSISSSYGVFGVFFASLGFASTSQCVMLRVPEWKPTQNKMCTINCVYW